MGEVRRMKRFYEKCMNNLRYGGLKKEEYQEIEQEIWRRIAAP